MFCLRACSPLSGLPLTVKHSCACVTVTHRPVPGCVVFPIYMCGAHVSTCLVVCRLCVCVLKLFLETAAVGGRVRRGGIIRSTSTDIPRMPSSVSDPCGENIAETKARRGSGIPPSFPKGLVRSGGTHSAGAQRAQGDTYSCNTWDRIMSSEDAESHNMVI